MPANFVLLERIELNASAASVTFNNIPQTGYTDLKIVASARTDNTGAGYRIKASFNGSSSNFTGRFLYGGGSGSGASSTVTNEIFGFVDGTTETASTFSNNEIYIPNYLSTTTAKSVSTDTVMENNATQAYAALWAGLWNPGTQAAINSVTLTAELGNFVANSTFSLYGLAAVGTTPVIAPKASGGNRIDNDGTYWYHTFTSSGTFTPATSLNADVLVIAGGGGGGCLQAGAGGAGGLLAFTSQSFSTSQTVTVGAGGAGSTSISVRGTNGVDSQFGSLTLVKGGGGGGSGATSGGIENGATGGSGGGGGNPTSGTGTGGSATSGQGFAGGSGSSDIATYRNGGGGGGAGGAGVSSTSGSIEGTGGAGTSAYSSWASATSTGVSGAYAGGGGGGGGVRGTATAGGGNGATNAAGANATISTGGGGGGGGYSSFTNGYAGGSGIIIVRYAI